MEKITIIKSNRFTTVDNGFVQNEKLSLKAKGLLLVLLSLPESFNISVKQLAARYCKDGVDSIYSGMKELKEFGFVETEPTYDENHRFTGNEYKVYEIEQPKKFVVSEQKTPCREFPDTVFPCRENPDRENPETASLLILNTIDIKEKLYKKTKLNDDLLTENAKIVFEFYCKTFENYYQPKPLPKWIDLIKDRLVLFTVEELKTAILSAKNQEHLTPKNPDDKNKTFYATIEYVCRNDAQVDKLMAMSKTVKTTPKIELPAVTEDYLEKLDQNSFVSLVKKHFGEIKEESLKNLNQNDSLGVRRKIIWDWHLEKATG